MGSAISLEGARELYDAVNGRAPYRQRKKRAESQVVEWRWATGPFYGLMPFEPECGQYKRGRPLSRAPKSRDGYEFGFDSAGRLVVERTWSGFSGPSNETFCEWAEGTVIQTSYVAGGVELSNAGIYSLVEGRLSHHASIGSADTLISSMDYVDSLVQKIREKFGRESYEREYRIVREGDVVVRIDYHVPAYDAVAWSLPPAFKQEWFVRPGERAGWWPPSPTQEKQAGRPATGRGRR